MRNITPKPMIQQWWGLLEVDPGTVQMERRKHPPPVRNTLFHFELISTADIANRVVNREREREWWWRTRAHSHYFYTNISSGTNTNNAHASALSSAPRVPSSMNWRFENSNIRILKKPAVLSRFPRMKLFERFVLSIRTSLLKLVVELLRWEDSLDWSVHKMRGKLWNFRISCELVSLNWFVWLFWIKFQRKSFYIEMKCVQFASLSCWLKHSVDDESGFVKQCHHSWILQMFQVKLKNFFLPKISSITLQVGTGFHFLLIWILWSFTVATPEGVKDENLANHIICDVVMMVLLLVWLYFAAYIKLYSRVKDRLRRAVAVSNPVLAVPSLHSIPTTDLWLIISSSLHHSDKFCNK